MKKILKIIIIFFMISSHLNGQSSEFYSLSKINEFSTIQINNGSLRIHYVEKYVPIENFSLEIFIQPGQPTVLSINSLKTVGDNFIVFSDFENINGFDSNKKYKCILKNINNDEQIIFYIISS